MTSDAEKAFVEFINRMEANLINIQSITIDDLSYNELEKLLWLRMTNPPNQKPTGIAIQTQMGVIRVYKGDRHDWQG